MISMSCPIMRSQSFPRLLKATISRINNKNQSINLLTKHLKHTRTKLKNYQKNYLKWMTILPCFLILKISKKLQVWKTLLLRKKVKMKSSRKLKPKRLLRCLNTRSLLLRHKSKTRQQKLSIRLNISKKCRKSLRRNQTQLNKPSTEKVLSFRRMLKLLILRL